MFPLYTQIQPEKDYGESIPTLRLEVFVALLGRTYPFEGTGRFVLFYFCNSKKGGDVHIADETSWLRIRF
jgi:hypothetical protein